jgi:hypothetical protein
VGMRPMNPNQEIPPNLKPVPLHGQANPNQKLKRQALYPLEPSRHLPLRQSKSRRDAVGPTVMTMMMTILLNHQCLPLLMLSLVHLRLSTPLGDNLLQYHKMFVTVAEEIEMADQIIVQTTIDPLFETTHHINPNVTFHNQITYVSSSRLSSNFNLAVVSRWKRI